MSHYRRATAFASGELAAKEKLILQHYLTLPFKERRKLDVNCGLVEYGDKQGYDKQYRAHAYDDDYNEIHVTDLSSHSGAKRLLREWAVANGLYCGDTHTRHRSLAEFRARCRAKMAHHWRPKADDGA
jgi:hypothetical protein